MVRREDRHCRKVFRQESTGELDITVEESAGVGMECKACGAMLEVSEVRDIGRGGEWRSEEYRKVGKCATTIDNINKALVRLNDLRARMVARGIRASPLQPYWCIQNNNCLLTM